MPGYRNHQEQDRRSPMFEDQSAERLAPSHWNEFQSKLAGIRDRFLSPKLTSIELNIKSREDREEIKKIWTDFLNMVTALNQEGKQKFRSKRYHRKTAGLITEITDSPWAENAERGVQRVHSWEVDPSEAKPDTLLKKAARLLMKNRLFQTTMGTALIGGISTTNLPSRVPDEDVAPITEQDGGYDRQAEQLGRDVELGPQYTEAQIEEIIDKVKGLADWAMRMEEEEITHNQPVARDRLVNRVVSSSNPTPNPETNSPATATPENRAEVRANIVIEERTMIYRNLNGRVANFDRYDPNNPNKFTNIEPVLDEDGSPVVIDGKYVITATYNGTEYEATPDNEEDDRYLLVDQSAARIESETTPSAPLSQAETPQARPADEPQQEEGQIENGATLTPPDGGPEVALVFATAEPVTIDQKTEFTFTENPLDINGELGEMGNSSISLNTFFVAGDAEGSFFLLTDRGQDLTEDFKVTFYNQNGYLWGRNEYGDSPIQVVTTDGEVAGFVGFFNGKAVVFKLGEISGDLTKPFNDLLKTVGREEVSNAPVEVNSFSDIPADMAANIPASLRNADFRGAYVENGTILRERDNGSVEMFAGATGLNDQWPNILTETENNQRIELNDLAREMGITNWPNPDFRFATTNGTEIVEFEFKFDLVRNKNGDGFEESIGREQAEGFINFIMSLDEFGDKSIFRTPITFILDTDSNVRFMPQVAIPNKNDRNNGEIERLLNTAGSGTADSQYSGIATRFIKDEDGNLIQTIIINHFPKHWLHLGSEQASDEVTFRFLSEKHVILSLQTATAILNGDEGQAWYTVFFNPGSTITKEPYNSFRYLIHPILGSGQFDPNRPVTMVKIEN